MSFFYEEDTALQVKSDTSFTKGKRTGLIENTGAAFKAFVKSELFSSERNNLSEEYGNMVNILHKAGHADMVNPLDQQFNPFTMENIDPNDPQFAKNVDELQADFWNKVSTLQTTDENLKSLLSEAGLDTQDNMMGTISKKAHSAWKEYSEINERATTAGKIGGFGGMMGGAFTDPIMQLGVVASFGYSVPSTISAAALRVAYMEAIIGGVSETIIQLKAQPYRAELGFEDAGFETGLKNVAMVTGASAVLSPALLGVFKAFGKSIDAGKKLLSKTSVEDLQKINKEVGEKLNSKYKDKTLNDIEIPKKDNPFPDNEVGRTEHNERLDVAVKQVNNGDEVDLPPIKNEVIKDNLPPPAKLEFNDMTSSNPAIKNAYDGSNRLKKFTENKSPITVKMLEDISKDDVKLILRANELGLYKTRPEALIALDNLKRFTTKDGKVNYKAAEEFIGTKLKGNESLDDLLQLERSSRVTDAPEKVSQVDAKNGFNKNETKLAEDIEGVKNFDVPNEAALKNQASDIERSMFDVSTSSSIKSEAATGAAAKTSPTELSEATQTLSKGSQKTEATPVSVLANANTVPPLFRGLDTSKVGVKSAITNDVIYHISDDFNEIYKTLSAKKNAVLKELQPITIKYNGELKARIKSIKELNKKLKHKTKPKKPEHISDYLGTRINVRTIHEAQMVLNDLSKVVKFLSVDDFLNDAGRVAAAGTEYRAIHAQVLTKDGFSFELQIRLKELENLTDKSHAGYKKIKFPEKEYTDAEFRKIVSEQASVEKKLKAKYFEIKDKEFTRLKSDNPLDRRIPISQRFDEATGEIVTINKTARELFEQEGKNNTMLERLKDCV
jgi:ppGpp synthetase/RelA/SpoT-type nucleotidyltranferase